jgi:o-succinylbenzoate synthase
MVTVRDVRILSFALPLRQPLTTASGRVAARRGFVVVLSDAEGHEGIGEATPHPAAPSSQLASLREELEHLKPQLRGREIPPVSPWAASLSPVVRSALDMAAHDLLGVATDRSVTSLLGAALRAAVPVSALLAGTDDADCVRAARAAVEHGYDIAKLKIGPDPERAVRRIAAVRAAAPSLRLRCDANGAWDAGTAIGVARRLSTMDIEWLEQPVAAADLEGMRRVRQAAGIALAADEAVTAPDVVPRLAGVVDAVVLKLVQVGGLAAARATAEAAARQGLRVTVTTAIETSIATVAALHLAASLACPLEACGLATAALLADDLVDPVPREGPLMVAPPGPGLAVRLRAAAISPDVT